MAAIVRSPKNDRHRIDTELAQPELAAIGYLTVLWAELEHTSLHETAKLPGLSVTNLPHWPASVEYIIALASKACRRQDEDCSALAHSDRALQR